MFSTPPPSRPARVVVTFPSDSNDRTNRRFRRFEFKYLEICKITRRTRRQFRDYSSVKTRSRSLKIFYRQPIENTSTRRRTVVSASHGNERMLYISEVVRFFCFFFLFSSSLYRYLRSPHTGSERKRIFAVGTRMSEVEALVFRSRSTRE